MKVLPNVTVVIILQYNCYQINIYIYIYLKLAQCYVGYMSIKLEKKKEKK